MITVFLFSDANLSQYGITVQSMAAALLGNPAVNSYAIFIAGEAEAGGDTASNACATRTFVLILPHCLRFSEIFAIPAEGR